jgi:hypothetical protein
MTKSNVKNVVMIALLIFGAVSCKKDKAEPAPAPTLYPEESFLDGYLNSTGFSQALTNYVSSSNFEFGLEFKPTVKGKITSLLVKLPDVRTDLRVTIWDKATQMPIRTETVNVAVANTQYDFDIADLELVKDKEYTITMNSNDWYDRKKTNGNNATYPVVSGNITIISYKWVAGTAQTYPTIVSLSYYAGDCTFKFRQID